MKYVKWSMVLALGVGCNFEDGELNRPEKDPATMSDLGGGVNDLGTTPVSPDMKKPLAQDMDSPDKDMLTMPVDQGTPPIVDMGEAQDMTMADMSPVDQGMTSPMCGNNVLEAGELCDGNCPVSCDDDDVCTSNIRAGQDATCNVLCSYPVITACSTGDGCCPSGCDFAQDEDCMPPDMPDCADDATWPSGWSAVASQSRGQVNLARTSGQCQSMSSPPQPSLNQSAALTQAARCMAIWKKTNPGASGQQLLSRLIIEVGNAGYSGSNVQFIGGGGSSAMGAQNQIVSSTQNCQDIASTSYNQIGVGYVDGTIGNTDHLVAVILGE